MSDNSNATWDWSSPAPFGRYLKRRRLEDLNSSSSNSSNNDSILGTQWELRRTKRELATLRDKLSETEATVIEHHKLRKQTEGLFEKEKNILQVQAQVDKQTIAQLQEDLKTSVRHFHEAREAQAAAEADISLMKTRMEKQIAELGKANRTFQQEFQLLNAELKEAKMTIERLNSEKRPCGARTVLLNNLRKKRSALESRAQEEKKRAAVLTENNAKKPSIVFPRRPSGVMDLRALFLAKTLDRKVPPTNANGSRASSSEISDKENSFSPAAPFRQKGASSPYSSSSGRGEYVDDSSSRSSNSSSEFSSESSSNSSSNYSSPDYYSSGASE